MKKLIAFILAATMLLTLAACGGGGNAGSEVSNDIPEGKQIPDDAVLDVVITSHPSNPYQENWKVWEYIKDAIGGTVNITAIPEADFGTKFPLIMASTDELPDVIAFGSKPESFADFCSQGAFLAFDDHLDFMPDYKEFWKNIPEEERWMYDTRLSSDGKIYYSPMHGLDRITNIRGWLYRKDIFEKHNLKTPETIDELYEVSKQLKEIYPESYPFCLRSALNNINIIGSSWKEYFCYNQYYDFNAEKWCYGAREEVMLDVITFLNKMISEELAPADCFTINTTTWQELVLTDRGFIMPEYQTRINFFNTLARTQNPKFTISATLPPKAEGGVNKVNKFNNPPQGMAVVNTGDEGRIANAFRYVNWFYTDEAIELVSWGKEGETFEFVNGEKKFINDDPSKTIDMLYGINSRGAQIAFDPDAAKEVDSEEQYALTDFLLEHTVDNLNPEMWLSLSDEETKKIADLSTTIDTLVKENIQKFAIGQRPLSEWDAFQADLAELPIDDLLSVYEEAYNRVK